MRKIVISVENLTKIYDLGVIGTGTLSRDLNRCWARLRHQPDPYTRIGSLLEVGTGFHPELTGRENVFLNGAILSIRKLKMSSLINNN